MKIRVTKKHIKNGVAQSCSYCPVALALKEKLHMRVAVDEATIRYFRLGFREYTADTPEEVADFIDQFDSELPVKPFTFEVSFHRGVWSY